jgi:hypothetical protein
MKRAGRIQASSLAVHAPYTQKSENAEASLTKIFPAASVNRYNKPDVNSRRWPSVFPLLPKDEPTPFRCPGPHSPSRVEGVAGTIAIGRRPTTFRSMDQTKHRSGMSCGESLVSSIAQSSSTRLTTRKRTLDRVGFSPPIRASSFPYDTVRILAEPFYNNNLRSKRQIFRQLFAAKITDCTSQDAVAEAVAEAAAGR